jgi:GT2 family glycosyltransferase
VPGKALAIIPAYVRTATDVGLVADTLASLRATAGDACDVLVVDDCSPAGDLVSAVSQLCDKHDAELYEKPENTGFSASVNVGLQRCLGEGRDAVLVNADIVFGLTRDWLGLMVRQRRQEGDGLASIVGALLLYPNGLIQHAGIYFSLLTRDFNHRYNFGPGDLPEAQHAAVCPVTGALQFIRHECLEAVGPYDEGFRMGFEDVDMCLRTMLSGRECVYQPGVRAIHHESAFRGRPDEKIAKWTNDSWLRLVAKYAEQSFAAFVPNLPGAYVARGT